MSKKDTVYIAPLGGLGEIGKNMMAIEYEDDMFLIDCGFQFPDIESPGVDFIIPDWSYIQARKKKIRALILTHGHEDHIGAVPFFLKEFHVPLYGSELTIGLVRAKLEEHGLKDFSEINVISKEQTVSLGSFNIEFIRVNHSIPDCFALAFHTPIGVIVHTADFKIDLTPADNIHFNLSRFAQLGKQGVLLLMSDSTNVERQGWSLSETELGEKFAHYIKTCQGRLYIATFASNLLRIKQIIEVARQLNKKVAIIGRSMERNVQIASELGYLQFPADLRVNLKEINSYPKDQVIILITGSQGEPMSVLTQMSKRSHHTLSLEPHDTVMISAGIIPGNEKTVFRLINNLFRHGADVIYRDLADVHVSGHASRDELKMMIELTRPKFLLPVHGEYRHLVLHARIGEEMGIPADHIPIAEIGNVLQLRQYTFRIAEQRLTNQIFVDGKGIGDVSPEVLRDRQNLADDGIVFILVNIDKQPDIPRVQTEIFSRGFVLVKESDYLLEPAKEHVNALVEKLVKDGKEIMAIKAKVKSEMRSYFYKLTERKPVMLIYVADWDSLFQ